MIPTMSGPGLAPQGTVEAGAGEPGEGQTLSDGPGGMGEGGGLLTQPTRQMRFFQFALMIDLTRL